MSRGEFAKILRDTRQRPASDSAVAKIVKVKIFHLRLFLGRSNAFRKAFLPIGFTSRVKTKLGPWMLVSFFRSFSSSSKASPSAGPIGIFCFALVLFLPPKSLMIAVSDFQEPDQGSDLP